MDIAPNRSDVELQAGYFLTRRLSLTGSGQYSYTHQGLEFRSTLFRGGVTEVQWLRHDQIAKASLLTVSGGASYAVNGLISVFASVGHAITGRNGHLPAVVLTFGFSRSFGARIERTRTSAVDGEPAPQRALVCMCPKK